MIANYSCDVDGSPNALHFNLELAAIAGVDRQSLDLCVTCTARALLNFIKELSVEDKRLWVEGIRKSRVSTFTKEISNGR